MNRYPVWKYAIIVIALLVGVLYTLPNFFGEAPAVQVSSAKSTVKVDNAVLQKVESALSAASVKATSLSLDGTSVRARFDTPDEQLKAKDVIQKALVPMPPTRLHRGAEPGVALARLADGHRPCTWAWTCAAACTSCCRWTWQRP
jgi:hypothetical protein